MKEYEAAIKWYRQGSEKAALGFVNEFHQILDVLRKMPDRYRKTYKTYREIYLKKYPYSIVYKINETSKTVSLVSVYHCKRNPKGKYTG